MALPPSTIGHHLIVPFAACADPAGRELGKKLTLAHLERLLARLTPTAYDGGDEWQPAPPHERALARALGLAAADGAQPWAAWQHRQAGGEPGTEGWAWFTPCHWSVGNARIVMHHPKALALDARQSQTLLSAVDGLARHDGLRLQYQGPTLWLAQGELLRGLATASLDRVIGRDIDRWMPQSPQAQPLRRLMGEIQMVLYHHPLNAERERGGLLPVNSVWISGSGALAPDAPATAPPGLRETHVLRDAALLGDWQAWADGWRQIDASECKALLAAAERGEPVALTLCGERAAQRFEALPRSLFRQLASRMARVRAWDALEPL